MDAIQDRLDGLDHSGPLSVDQALDIANDIANQVRQMAAPLEESGDFEQAAYLYEQAARAFEIAAEKVSSADREQVNASGELWSVKAEVTRYRVYTASLTSSAEPSEAPTTDIPEPRTTSRPARPPTNSLKKPGETQDEPWTIAPLPGPASESAPPDTIVKKPGESRDGRWSVDRVLHLDGESQTPGVALKKLGKVGKKPASKSAYKKPEDQ